MVSLLAQAVIESTHPGDKFIFVSETTLPVKPFFEVYDTLTQDANSDFCIFPTDHWVQLDLAQNLRALIVEHSQWVVLNPTHARILVQNWPAMKAGFRVNTWSIPVYNETRKGPWGQITNPAGVLPLPMCVDEWAIFATIYGAFVDKGELGMSKDLLPGLNLENAALQFRAAPGAAPGAAGGSVDAISGHQGLCRTFAFWDAADMGASHMLAEILKDWPWSKISCFPKCESSHPAVFEFLSDRGVTALRNSRYLFVRKFDKQVVSLDQFQRIILASSSANGYLGPSTAVQG